MNMKKYLYATTAIIGVSAMASGAQAQGVEASISGFINGYYGIVDYDTDANTDETQELAYQEAELNLTGSYTLDNGVEAGIYIQNELEGGAAEADEQYLYLSGSFGTLQLGQQNGAAYVTGAYASSAYAAGVPVNSGWFIMADQNGDYDGAFLAPGYSTYGDMTNDDNGVVYKTPRISGFQVAASWHPSSGQQTGTNFNSGNGATGGSFGSVNENAQHSNAWSIGANFSRDFNGVGIDASAGFSTESRDNVNVANADPDPKQYMFGLGASVSGFSFGGDLLIQEDGVMAGVNSSNDGIAYSIGGSYSAGPFTLAVNGIRSEIEGSLANNGEDERDALVVGLDYALGPGVTLASSVNYMEFDNEEGTETEGLSGTLGATVSF